MKTITLIRNNDFTTGEVTLPSSKSLSNRALIIQSLLGNRIEIHRLSTSNDTKNLVESLSSTDEIIDIGEAGTNMRFLISLLSLKEGRRILTGNKRMQTRPIGVLVNCLRSLGAEIKYLKEEGFPPIEVIGGKLKGGKITIDGSISSQFTSSLLLIAPSLKNGLELTTLSQQVSRAYIDMTLGLMSHFGINFSLEHNKIIVPQQLYQPNKYAVELDWSSAAFWYGMIATSKLGTKILLKGLQSKSLQGDKRSIEYFTELGVESTENEKGICIEKIKNTSQHITFDLVNEPDLFPALAYTCGAMGITASFLGLQTLNLKESKRIEAVANELQKTGIVCTHGEDYFNIVDIKTSTDSIVFATHDDHRLAMAASIFIHKYPQIVIQDPEVVGKSYPGFWNDIVRSGIANY